MGRSLSAFADKVEERLRKLLRRETTRTTRGERRMTPAESDQLAGQLAHSSYSSTVRKWHEMGADADGTARHILSQRRMGHY